MRGRFPLGEFSFFTCIMQFHSCLFSMVSLSCPSTRDLRNYFLQKDVGFDFGFFFPKIADNWKFANFECSLKRLFALFATKEEINVLMVC